jgi:hypothetical protein
MRKKITEKMNLVQVSDWQLPKSGAIAQLHIYRYMKNGGMSMRRFMRGDFKYATSY